MTKLQKELAKANGSQGYHWVHCPICRGRIQATVSVDMDGLHLSADGKRVVNDGSACNSEIESVYCENDHEHSEMIDYIQIFELANKP